MFHDTDTIPMATPTFIESPFQTKVEYNAFLALPAAEQQAALKKLQPPAAAKPTNCPLLPQQLERKDGSTVGQEALADLL